VPDEDIKALQELTAEILQEEHEEEADVAVEMIGEESEEEESLAVPAA